MVSDTVIQVRNLFDYSYYKDIVKYIFDNIENENEVMENYEYLLINLRETLSRDFKILKRTKFLELNSDEKFLNIILNSERKKEKYLHNVKNIAEDFIQLSSYPYFCEDLKKIDPEFDKDYFRNIAYKILNINENDYYK